MRFSRRYARKTQRHLRIVKVSKPGAGLVGREFDPHRPGYKYVEMIRDTQLALQSGAYTLKALIWVQGEEDSKHLENALAYQSCFADFISSVRQKFGMPDLPVICARYTPDRLRDRKKRFLYPEPINEAFVALADQGVHLVETGDLPKRDAVHFNTKGIGQLGVRLADKAMDVLGLS